MSAIEPKVPAILAELKTKAKGAKTANKAPVIPFLLMLQRQALKNIKVSSAQMYELYAQSYAHLPEDQLLSKIQFGIQCSQYIPRNPSKTTYHLGDYSAVPGSAAQPKPPSPKAAAVKPIAKKKVVEPVEEEEMEEGDDE